MTFLPQQGGQLVRPWLPLPVAYDHPGSEHRLRLAHRIAHEHEATANQVTLAWHLAGPRSNLLRPAGSVDTGPADLPQRRVAMIPVFGARTVEQLDKRWPRPVWN